MSGLRLDLIVRTYLQDGGYKSVDRWTWRLWSGSKIVSTSGKQLYSRRIDCARGAEVGAGLTSVIDGLKCGYYAAYRQNEIGGELVEVRIIDERATP